MFAASPGKIHVIFEQGHELYGAGIKSSQTYHQGFRKNLDWFHETVHELARRFILHSEDPILMSDGVSALNFQTSSSFVD